MKVFSNQQFSIGIDIGICDIMRRFKISEFWSEGEALACILGSSKEMILVLLLSLPIQGVAGVLQAFFLKILGQPQSRILDRFRRSEQFVSKAIPADRLNKPTRLLWQSQWSNLLMRPMVARFQEIAPTLFLIRRSTSSCAFSWKDIFELFLNWTTKW